MLRQCSLLVIVGVTLLLEPHGAAAADGEALSRFVFQYQLLSEKYKPLLSEITPEIFTRAGLPAPQINESYDPSKLNLLVVKSLEFDPVDPTSLPNNQSRRLYLATRYNFIAVPPNVVIVDEAAITRILLSSVAAMTSHNNYGLDFVLEKDDFPNVTEASLWTNRKANMLRVAWLLELYGERLDTKEAYELGRSKILDNLTASGTEVEMTKTAYQGALAPVLLHESAHALSSDLGAFLDGLIEYVFGPDQLKRENAADAFAIKLLADYIGVEQPDVANPRRLGVSAYTDYLSLSVLSSALAGIRGFWSPDLALRYDFFPCEAWDERLKTSRTRWEQATKKSGVPGDTPEAQALLRVDNDQDANFRNPLLLRAAMFADMLPLTEPEFDQVSKRLTPSLGGGTHSPDLLRADFFANLDVELMSRTHDARFSGKEMLDAQKTAYFAQARALVEAVMNKNPLLAHPPASLRTGEGLRASQKDIVDAFSGVYDFEPAVNCPAGDCVVGHLKSGRAGFIEIVGNSKGVQRIRLATKLGQEGDEKFFTDESLKDQNVQIEAQPYLLVIAAVAEAEAERMPSDQQAGASQLVAKVSDAIDKGMTTCGVTSTLDKYGKVLVSSYPMNSIGWLSVVIQPI